MTEPMQLLLVGKLRPERKRSLTGMAVAADLQTVAIEESSQALTWLDNHAPGCVLVDAGAGRLDKLVGKLRADPQLSHVPVFALVSAPDDLWLEQYFGWGGDDVVHVDAGATLLERLRAVPREPPPTCAGRRVAIGDPDKARIEAMGRVFRLAGFEVFSALDRTALEATLFKQRPAVVVANSVLGELPDLIGRARNNGSTSAFVVLTARRELESQQQALCNVEHCAVLGAQVNPWQVLYRANQLARPQAKELRSEPRRAFGSFVLFRPAGSDEDDVGIAYNLSSRGMFVRTFAPVLSEDVWLEWRVPQDATRVRIEGRVSFRQTSFSNSKRAACPMGFGVEFRDYLGGARKHLDRALELLDAAALKSASTRPSPGSMAPASADATWKSASPTSVPPLRPTGSASEPPPAGDANATSTTGSSKAPAGRPLSLPPTVEKLAQARPLSLGPNASIKPLASVIPTMVGLKANSGGIAKGSTDAPSADSTPPIAEPADAGSKNPDTTNPPKSDAPEPRLAVKRKQAAALDAKRPRVPPRPAGTPPSVVPPRVPLLSPIGATAPTPEPTLLDTTSHAPAAVLSDANVDVQVRRFDTLRDAVAFDDLPENTDPVADHQLLEDAPTSSDPTEIRVTGIANLEVDASALIPQKGSDVSDDPSRTSPDQAMHAPAAAVHSPAERHDTEPSSRPAAGEIYAAEEQVTRQWRGAAAADEQDSSMLPDVSRPRRRWRIVLGSICGIGVGLGLIGYFRPSLLTSPSSVEGRPTTLTKGPSVAEPGQALGGDKITPRPEPSAGASPAKSDAEPVERVAADAAVNHAVDGATSAAPDRGDPGSVPWAKPDDGAPREGFPPIEDPYGGKGRLLADGYGYLIVRFPEAAFIFSNSIAMGATNWKIATPCGEKTLRIGLGEKPTTWLSNEARVNIACRGTTNVLFERLPDVAVPPGVKRPIAPGTMSARKSASETNPKGSNGDGNSSALEHDSATQPTKRKERDDNGSEQQQ